MTSVKKTKKEVDETSVKDGLGWRKMIGGAYDLIVDNVPFLAFVSLLCVLYISNTHRAVEMQRDLAKYNKELKELRWEYMDAKSQLMNVQMEAEVIKSGNKIGLTPLSLPAYRIKANNIEQ